MKTTLLSALVFFISLVSNSVDAQSSCLLIERSSFRVISGQQNPCERSISFNFTNPSNGNRRIKVMVTSGNTVVYSNCIDASGQKDVVRNFTSSDFSVCNLGDMMVSITPITGNNCDNAGCEPALISIGGAPLPVTYSYFKAARNNETVLLQWETVTEINNTGFAVERNNGNNWEQVGFVAAKSLNGNSNEKINYQYSEVNSSKNMSQYRLRQIDIDGKSKYSEVRAVRGTGQEAKTIIYPNPSLDGKVNVVFADASLRNIILTNMAGQTIKQWNSFNSNSLSIAGLSTGMFTLHISNLENGSGSIQKIMVTGK